MMTPILERIARVLIAATPETWAAATMRVEFKRLPSGETEMAHSICSEQQPKFAVPSDEIYSATYELHQVCEGAKQPWVALVFTIEQIDDNWKFSTNFEYDAKT
jgi:hypothetical protein